jgi:hypothetical protein
VFLISVAIGYFSALIQLHFQHAQPGSTMPSSEDSVRIFHGRVGEAPKSHLVRLNEADESLPFNGNGQMSAAFTRRSPGWKTAITKKARAMAKGSRRGEDPNEEELALAEQALREERNGEKTVLIAWLHAGAQESAYEQNRFNLPKELTTLPITKNYREEDTDGPYVKIKDLWNDRCIRCHAKTGGDPKASQYPLETVAEIAKYNKVEDGSAMSLTKLAQTTHVHLLGFSMLYGLTGLIFALSSWPGVLRVVLAPLPLVAQVVDISFWWLARLDGSQGEMFARAIPLTGAIVAVGLGLQILLTLLSLFGRFGKVVLILLIIAAGFGAHQVKERIVDPYMESERSATTRAQ